MQQPKWRYAGVLADLVSLSSAALADIHVGVTVSATRPQAPLGQLGKNATALWPSEVDGERVDMIVFDDASDTTRTAANTRKLMGESSVDVIVGLSTTPNTPAMIDVAAEGKTPVISLASSARLIKPMDTKRRQVFEAPHSDSHIASLITEHATAYGMKTIAYTGFASALGEAFLTEVQRLADLKHIRVTDTERLSPTDNNMTAQVLHLLANKPNAVMIGSSGTPAALPARALAERGYIGKIYFSHGVSNNDFIRLCGKDCEGAYMPAGPVTVTAELPDTNPAKRQALDFAHRYEATFGHGSVSIFTACTSDIGLLLQHVVPVTLKRAKLGTPTFREALRDTLEQVHDLPTGAGVTDMSPQDHVGLDQRARVMAQICRDQWHLADAMK